MNFLLTYFLYIFDVGRASLTTSTMSLLKVIIILEIIFAGIYMAIGGSADLRNIAKKILLIGFITFVVTNYTDVLKDALDGFILVGDTAAGGSGNNINIMRNPGAIIERAITIVTPAFEKMFNSSVIDLLSVDMLFTLICTLIIIIAFELIAIQVFITYVEFTLITSMGLILLPFSIFGPMKFLGEKLFGVVIGFGIKFMTLSLIVTVSTKFMAFLSITDSVGWQNMLDVLVIAMSLAFLSLHAPAVAMSLLSGSPQLTAGTVGAAANAGSSLMGTAGSSGVSAVKAAATGGAMMHVRGADAASSVGGGGSGGGSGTTSGGAGAKLKSMATKTAMYAGGAAMGLGAGIASNVGEKIKYGKDQDGKVGGRNDVMRKNGLDPKQGGIMGAINRGKFAEPNYRKKHDNPTPPK